MRKPRKKRKPEIGGLTVLHKTAEFATEVSTVGLTFAQVAEANMVELHKAREGWKGQVAETTVSETGVVRRRNVNYGRDTASKLLPLLNAGNGPLYTLNRLIGLSELNQGLIEIQSGDLPSCAIPVTVHLPQVGKVIQSELVPRYRFGKGFRQKQLIDVLKAVAGKKRMVMTELGSDSDTPQLQITFY